MMMIRIIRMNKRMIGIRIRIIIIRTKRMRIRMIRTRIRIIMMIIIRKERVTKKNYNTRKYYKPL